MNQIKSNCNKDHTCMGPDYYDYCGYYTNSKLGGMDVFMKPTCECLCDSCVFHIGYDYGLKGKFYCLNKEAWNDCE
jgi:hypothetical protein